MRSDAPASLPTLDREGTLARLGGDEELFSDLAGYLVQDAPALFDEVRVASAAGDAAEVRSRAHALKGLLAGCGGIGAAHLAQRLEKAGASADLDDAPMLLSQLESELGRLFEALQPYLR